MTTKCNLILDSCCELPPEMLRRDGVFLLNYVYTLDGEVHVDDMFEKQTPHDFYEAMRNGAEPQTSQLPMPILSATFEKAMAADKPAVFLSFSSALTGTLDTARMVYDGLRADNPDGQPVYFYDTKLAATAEGLFVLEALTQWEKGLTAQEMLDWAEQAAPHVNEMFVVDDLTALKRGGRIPPALAVIGSKLDVKPLLDIDVTDGSLHSCGIARGKKKAIKQMVGLFTKLIPEQNRAGRLVLIGNADCPEDAKRLEDLLCKTARDLKIMHMNIGPVIGSHVGPGMLSMVFWGPDSRK
ncbi:MAG: DegV family protein [Coriobacteriia bacterium]|nr:DegV family protein [Coriobacteriia bacterium]